MAYEGLQAEMVKFQGFKDDRGDAYYAHPTRAGRFPGVVVIHHLPGWDEWIIELGGIGVKPRGPEAKLHRARPSRRPLVPRCTGHMLR